MSAMPDGWQQEEAGWWTKSEVGGVCREADHKWYGHPMGVPLSDRAGPFSTAKEAAVAVDATHVVCVEN